MSENGEIFSEALSIYNQFTDSLKITFNISVGPFACRKESIIETMLLKHKRSKLVLSLIETPGFGPSSMGTDW